MCANSRLADRSMQFVSRLSVVLLLSVVGILFSDLDPLSRKRKPLQMCLFFMHTFLSVYLMFCAVLPLSSEDPEEVYGEFCFHSGAKWTSTVHSTTEDNDSRTRADSKFAFFLLVATRKKRVEWSSPHHLINTNPQ